MGKLTASAYARVKSPVDIEPLTFDRSRVYAALDAASDGRQIVEAPARADAAWIIRLAHVAVKFRYTRPGRWIARALPPGLQRRLKARLLTTG